MSPRRRFTGHRALSAAIVAGLGTTLLALAVSWPSQRIMATVVSPIAVTVLLAIVILGVIADMVGVAVTVANEAPFHAMATKRRPGGRQALWLTGNADRVASFCSDIVGDIAGIISGAAAAVLVLRLAIGPGDPSTYTIVVTSLLAGVTVAGKAAGKVVALRSANEITLRVGLILKWLRFSPEGRRRVSKRPRRKGEYR